MFALVSRAVDSAVEQAVLGSLDPYALTKPARATKVAGCGLYQLPSIDGAQDPEPTSVVSWARIDNRNEIGGNEGAADDQLLVAAHDRWGLDCPSHLVGDFSFAIVDPDSGEVFGARDPLGVRPFYYAVDSAADGPRLIISTTAATFPALGDVTLTPSERWMANFISRSSMTHTDTAWEEVKKLPAGHTLTWKPGDETVTVNRYHHWRNDPPKAKGRTKPAVDDYRAVLDEAVRCRLAGTEPIGIETSGGIDSSTCLALAAKLGERDVGDIHAFGYVTAEKEPDHILQTSEMYGIENNHIFGDGFEERHPTTDIMDRTIDVLGYPAEHANGPGHDIFYRRCEELGIHHLQSGFGGDEVVTNPGGPLFRELIDQRRFVTLYKAMAGPWYEKFARTVKTLWTQRPGVARASRLRAGLEPMVALYGLRDDVDQRTGASETQLNRMSYDEGFRDLNEWILTERLGNSFVPTRLENCSLMARSRGVEYSWPLLDQRLIQQYLSTPSIEKRGPGIGRYLHRRAIDGDVPRDVAWKVSKEMGEPMSGSPQPMPAERIERVLGDIHPTVEALVDVDKIRRVAAMTTSNAERVTRTQINQIDALNHWLHRHHPTPVTSVDA